MRSHHSKFSLKNSTTNERDDAANSAAKKLSKVSAAGAAVLLTFFILFLISAPFAYESNQAKPILTVVVALVGAAMAATWGLWQANQIPRTHYRQLLFVILAFAVSSRLVAAFTCPILEIDYYRYLWDGKVVAEGHSPYRFSPAQVLAADSESDADLFSLGLLADRSASNRTILRRVHFENHTSVYPPVSQFIFGLTMKWFPASASVQSHVLAIKLTMLSFDLATLGIVCSLLSFLKLHPGWVLTYAWNPLVIKEIANSGHLDSAATFLMLLALFCIVRWLSFNKTTAMEQKTPHAPAGSPSLGWLIGGGISLGLGFGAKLFPIVLVPALAIAIARRSLSGTGLFSVAFFLTAAVVMLPLRVDQTRAQNTPPQQSTAQGTKVGSTASESKFTIAGSTETPPQENSEHNGFNAFFSSWRMNSPVFSTVYLNIGSTRSDSNSHWFVITQRQWRTNFLAWCSEELAGIKNPAFLLARIATLAVFLLFYAWQLVSIYQRAATNFNGRWYLSRLGIILAVFLMLQPTVNPWYFVWFAPLVCFSKNQGWLIASSLLSIYYSRFWFQSVAGPYEVAGDAYDGAGLFDNFVVFLEFASIAIVLLYFRASRWQNPGVDNVSSERLHRH